MNANVKPKVCIVGAGSMGIITAYHLELSGAEVSFLVRPHNRERLSKPQLLYSYDDNSLKTFSNYGLITSPDDLASQAFDFIVITLDGNALRSADGRKMVDAIGRSCRGTSTGIVLGSMGIDLRSQFLEQSGLAAAQVTNGLLVIFAYEEGRASMPVHPGVRADLRAQATYGYCHPNAAQVGFAVDLSAPNVARDFTDLYGRSGVSQCTIMSAEDYKLQMTVFAPLMAFELLDWSSPADIDPTDEAWQLGIEAMREFQRLSLYGPEGLLASEQTNAEAVLAMFRQIEKDAAPFDFAAFFRYHHGGKVNSQDVDILREAVALGAAEGADMPALRTLVRRLEERSQG